MKITAAEDGRVWVERGQWAGQYRNWRTEKKRIAASPEQLAAFRAKLDPHRPKGKLWLDGENSACRTFYNDFEERVVSWRGPTGEDQLLYDFGCDPEARAGLRDDLEAAPATLGVAVVAHQWVATTRAR